MQGNALAKAIETPLRSAQVDGLTQLVRGYSTEQLIWASGYLAGLAAGGPAVVAEQPLPQSEPAHRWTVLYGSQTGNGRGVAERAAEALAQKGYAADLVDMAQFKPAQLKRLSHLLIVVSTHGDGDPPDDAMELHEFLTGPRAPRLTGLHYAVLALGDSSYANFCHTGREFDERLEQLGAKRLFARVDCDLDYESSANDWIAQSIARAEAMTPATTARAPALRAVPQPQRYDKGQPFSAEWLVNQKITGRRSTKDVRHVELATEGLDYLPGDSVGVLSRNPPELIAEILEQQGLSGDAPVGVAGRELSLGEALSAKLEITGLSRSFIEKYAEFAAAPALRDMLADSARPALARYLADRQVVDVLREHPARPDAQQFADTLRALTPRLYSIASSADAAPGEAHLTVAVVDYTAFGRRHWGAASTHLAYRGVQGETLSVYVESNPRFRLPADPDTPLIMVGPGTGVAPFRAFLQQREADGASGRNWLFFGDRRFDADFLYQIEWLRWRQRGLLTRLDVAFSRDQVQKIYVQDRMREHGSELYAWLEEGAAFYVCGDAKHMAEDVDRALRGIVAEHGGLSEERAGEYLRELRRAGRYQRDVY